MFSDYMLQEDHVLLKVVQMSGLSLGTADILGAYIIPCCLACPVPCGASGASQAATHLLTKMSPDIAKRLRGGQDGRGAGGDV